MLHTGAALAVFGLLALVFMLGLNSGGHALSGLLPGGADFQPMVHARTGQPLTLEIVQKDVIWHRETARKLRALD